MLISFNIEYRTNWGEEVRIVGDIPELGDQQLEYAIPLHTIDGIHWTADVSFTPSADQKMVNYNYLICQDDKVVRQEWNSFQRRIYFTGDHKKHYIVYDSWKNLPEQSYFYSSAFTEALLAHHHRDEAPKS